jgi:hypothetical protein
MDVFTLPQLKKIVKHFGLKHIKVSVTKPQLIKQLDKYIHFDGYQFHIKGTEGYQLLSENDITHHKKHIDDEFPILQNIGQLNKKPVKIKKNYPKEEEEEWETVVFEEPKPKKIKVTKPKKIVKLKKLPPAPKKNPWDDWINEHVE